MQDLFITDHAHNRMAFRGLRKADIDYVVQNGQSFVVGGAIHYFLGRKNIPYRDRKFDRLNRLGGTTVLIDSHDRMTVITVYRNKKSNRKDRRKTKYNMHKRPGQYPLAG